MRIPVYYRRQLVGFIEEPTVDMFWFYGRWRPAKGAEATALFLQAIESGEEPGVGLSQPSVIDAYAMGLSDGIIEVRHIPSA
jgi:hypothetical protein